MVRVVWQDGGTSSAFLGPRARPLVPGFCVRVRSARRGPPAISFWEYPVAVEVTGLRSHGLAQVVPKDTLTMDLIKSLASLRKIGISIGSIVFVALSILWAFAIGLRDPERISLALVTLACSVGVGSLIGFVLTIFGDEIEALGKARDSLIALGRVNTI